MTLTPSDIEQKTFSTALRGYNLDEVDDFLDEVVRSMRKLQEDLDAARAELEERSAEPVAAPLPVAEPEPAAKPAPVVEPAFVPPPIDESAVGKALIAAQETADRIVSDARSEADRILVEAKSEADSFEETRLQRKAEAEQEISRFDGLVDRVKGELSGLSVAVGANLDEMSLALDQAQSELGDFNGDGLSDDEETEATEEEAGAPDDDAEETGASSDEPGTGGEDGDEDEDEDEDDTGEEYFDFPDEDDDSESGERTP